MSDSEEAWQDESTRRPTSDQCDEEDTEASTRHDTTVNVSTRHDTTVNVSTRHDTTVNVSTRHDTTVNASTRHDTTVNASTRHDTTVNVSTRHDTTVNASTRHDTTVNASSDQKSPVELCRSTTLDTPHATELSNNSVTTVTTSFCYLLMSASSRFNTDILCITLMYCSI